MNFFLVDDQFWEHPKVTDLSDAAAGLWAKAGSYSKYFGTGGHVPRGALRHLTSSRKVAPLVAELVAAKLWEFDAASDGYTFHNWSTWQAANEAATARRSAHARAQRAYRARHGGSARDQAGDHGGDHGGDHAAGQRDGHAGDHRDGHTVTPSRARVTNTQDQRPVSSSATGSGARASDDDDRSSPDTDDDGGWAGAGFVTPAQAQAAIVTATVREVTGMVIPTEAAAAILADVLGGRSVRDPAGYLRRAITAEASHDPALARWLAPPAPPGRPSAGERAPSARQARDVLDHARHPEGFDPGRVPDPEAAHRGADAARQMLAERPPPPAEAEAAPPPPVYTPDGDPTDPAALRAAQLAAEAEPPAEPPDPPPEPAEADDADVPF